MLELKKIVAMFRKMGCKDDSFPYAFHENLAMYQQWGLNTPEKICHFIAQCAHETTGFKYLQENMSYSTAKRIQKIFGKRRFPTLEYAQEFVRNPKRLANKVYNGRMGNRKNSNDGFKYKGAGIIHLTGFNNFSLYETLVNVGIVSKPWQASELPTCFDIAVKYFEFTTYKGFNTFYYAQLGDTHRVSRMVNGGTNGMGDRIKRTNKLLNMLDSEDKTGSMFPYPVLKMGDKGTKVKGLQVKLTDLGYDTNGIDGLFFDKTYLAVVQYQKDRGLTVDGVVGKQVYQSLKEETNG